MTQHMISKDLSMFMQTHQGQIVQVHSVFRRSVNLVSESGELVTLLAPGGWIAPMSAVLPPHALDIRSVKIGDKFEVSKSGLRWMRLDRRIRTGDFKVWKPSGSAGLRRLNPKELDRRRTALKTLIEKHGQVQGIVPLISGLTVSEDGRLWIQGAKIQDKYAEFIKPRLLELLEAVLRFDAGAVSDCIPGFVGFGPGLTPATDDFLLGLMLSMIHSDTTDQERLKRIRVLTEMIFEQARGRTTKISEEMLRHGAQGMAAQHYLAAVRALFYDVRSPYEKTWRDVLETGSTSGTDFLFGAYCWSLVNSVRSNGGGIENDPSGCS